MKPRRIHILGASGSGTTALGRALASALAIPHHDTDDYFWRPTVPPYREKRAVADRLRLMREMFLDRLDWVLSGSLEGWGDDVIARFDLVVFIEAPTAVRVARLRAREARHFGHDAVARGGWRHRETEEFVEWASRYDDGSREGRSRMRHDIWLRSLTCPVLRLDGTHPTSELVAEVLRYLGTDNSDAPPSQQHSARIDLRPADVADFAFCARLYFAEMEAAPLDPLLQQAKLRQRWAPDEIKIVIRDGVEVGWVQSRVEGASLFLAQLFVDAPFRRTGIGTHVVNRIIDEAGRTGKGVTLGVVKSNPALRIYERLGFRITHEDARKFYMRLETNKAAHP